jgi:hypothetical protein
MMMGITEDDMAVERIARAMASNSGVQWDRLDYYPGYHRGRWREEARTLLKALVESSRARAGP